MVHLLGALPGPQSHSSSNHAYQADNDDMQVQLSLGWVTGDEDMLMSDPYPSFFTSCNIGSDKSSGFFNFNLMNWST
jgi:hypothetical protein